MSPESEITAPLRPERVHRHLSPGHALCLVFTALTGGWMLTTSCLYEPPRQLPSSIRILYSRTTVDSLGTQVDIYFLVAREGNELRLTGEAGEDRQPNFATGLRKVFFSRASGAREEIWAMGLDGSQENVVLSSDGVDYRDPAVSPDDARLAFTRVENGRSEVWIADVDGQNPRKLLDAGGPWRQPAWSPDGRTVAVVGGAEGTGRIQLVPVSGGAPRPLVGGAGPQSEPAWSPDGARIAFVEGTGRSAEIAVAEVSGGSATRLTENDVPDAAPAWSTDGQRIAFVSRRPNDRDNVWLMDPDGRNVESLTRHEQSDARDPDWL